jgi:hypothetical protein
MEVSIFAGFGFNSASSSSFSSSKALVESEEYEDEDEIDYLRGLYVDSNGHPHRSCA